MNASNDITRSSDEGLDELVGLIDVLREPDAATARIDLVPGIREQLARETPRRLRPPRVGSVALFAGAAAAAILALLLAPVEDQDRDALRAKSAGSRTMGAAWTGVQVYREREHGVVEKLGRKITSDAFLLFSYTHVRPDAAAGHLAIFAVSSSGSVHWYHPAYRSAADNPAAIQVAHGSVDQELREKIQHELPAGPLAIYAVFSAEQLRVREIEEAVVRMVAERWPRREPPQLKLPGVYAQHLIKTEVEER